MQKTLKDDSNLVVFPRKQRKTRKLQSKTYRVDFRMPDGRRITKTFKRKYDADKFKRELHLEKQRFLDTGLNIKSDVSLDEYAKSWFENEVMGRKAHKTQLCYKSDLRNHIIPTLGKVRLKNLQYSHARKLENSILKTGATNRTVNKIMMVLKTIINDAVKTNHLLKNPIKGYPELKEQKRDLSYWSKDEVAQFLEANKNDSLINLYIVTLNLGLRLGEALGLCWDKVDFESNQVVVSRTLTRNGLQNTTKGGETRYLPMNDNVRTALKNELKKEIRGQFVFSQANGTALPYDHLTQRHFLQAQKRAKLTKRIRFHDLRHTFASHFMMNGGQIYTLQRLLGHKDIKTTMIYAHLDREFMRSASEVVKF